MVAARCSGGSVSLESVLASHMPDLARRWRTGELPAAVYAAAYFLVFQIAARDRRFASRKNRKDAKPDAVACLAELAQSDGAALRQCLPGYLERYQFLGVSPNVQTTLVAWLRGHWFLALSERIPSPLEVLRMQAEGTRPVTVLADYPRLLRPVLGKANGFAFLVHDLEHAYRFFHVPRLRAGQIGIFRGLLRAVDAGVFESYGEDPVFAQQLDYLVSDMNTHVIHSLRFLAATLIECRLRREGKQAQDALSPSSEAELVAWMDHLGGLWEFGARARSALCQLIAGGFTEADARCVEAELLNVGEGASRGWQDSSGFRPHCRSDA